MFNPISFWWLYWCGTVFYTHMHCIQTLTISIFEVVCGSSFFFWGMSFDSGLRMHYQHTTGNIPLEKNDVKYGDGTKILSEFKICPIFNDLSIYKSNRNGTVQFVLSRSRSYTINDFKQTQVYGFVSHCLRLVYLRR